MRILVFMQDGVITGVASDNPEIELISLDETSQDVIQHVPLFDAAGVEAIFTKLEDAEDGDSVPMFVEELRGLAATTTLH